jgi:hypothetical protein
MTTPTLRRFILAVLSAALLLSTPTVARAQVEREPTECALAPLFAPVNHFHAILFADRDVLKPEEFLLTIADIKDRCAAKVVTLQPNDLNYLTFLGEPFLAEEDLEFRERESRRNFREKVTRLNYGVVLGQLEMDREVVRSLIQYALNTEGACIDPTFRFALEAELLHDVRFRALKSRETPGFEEPYVDFALALMEVGSAVSTEIGSAAPEPQTEFALTPTEVYLCYESVRGRLATLLGEDFLTPEETDTLLKNPKITGSEAYRVRMHMLSRPNERIDQVTR